MTKRCIWEEFAPFYQNKKKKGIIVSRVCHFHFGSCFSRLEYVSIGVLVRWAILAYLITIYTNSFCFILILFCIGFCILCLLVAVRV